MKLIVVVKGAKNAFPTLKSATARSTAAISPMKLDVKVSQCKIITRVETNLGLTKKVVRHLNLWWIAFSLTFWFLDRS